MNGEEATRELSLTPSNAQDVPYRLVGSLSTNHYGIPPTKDADLVVDPESLSFGRLGKETSVPDSSSTLNYPLKT